MQKISVICKAKPVAQIPKPFQGSKKQTKAKPNVGP